MVKNSKCNLLDNSKAFKFLAKGVLIGGRGQVTIHSKANNEAERKRVSTIEERSRGKRDIRIEEDCLPNTKRRRFATNETVSQFLS